MTLPIHFCVKRSVELLCFGTSLERIATLIFTATVDKVKGDTSLYLTQAYEDMRLNMQGLTSVPYPLSKAGRTHEVKASINITRLRYKCWRSFPQLSPVWVICKHISANPCNSAHPHPHSLDIANLSWIFVRFCDPDMSRFKVFDMSSRSVTKVLATSLLYFHQAPSTGLTLKSRKTSTCSDHCGQCDFIRQILTLTFFWIQSLSSTGCLFLSLANKMYVSFRMFVVPGNGPNLLNYVWILKEAAALRALAQWNDQIQ